MDINSKCKLCSTEFSIDKNDYFFYEWIRLHIHKCDKCGYYNIIYSIDYDSVNKYNRMLDDEHDINVFINIVKPYIKKGVYNLFNFFINNFGGDDYKDSFYLLSVDELLTNVIHIDDYYNWLYNVLNDTNDIKLVNPYVLFKYVLYRYFRSINKYNNNYLSFVWDMYKVIPITE